MSRIFLKIFVIFFIISLATKIIFIYQCHNLLIESNNQNQKMYGQSLTGYQLGVSKYFFLPTTNKL